MNYQSLKPTFDADGFVVIQAKSCARDEAAFEQYLQASKSQHQELGLNVS